MAEKQSSRAEHTGNGTLTLSNFSKSLTMDYAWGTNIDEMSSKELKQLIQRHGGSFEGVLERTELVSIARGLVLPVPTSTSPTASEGPPPLATGASASSDGPPPLAYDSASSQGPPPLATGATSASSPPPLATAEDVAKSQPTAAARVEAKKRALKAGVLPPAKRAATAAPTAASTTFYYATMQTGIYGSKVKESSGSFTHTGDIPSWLMDQVFQLPGSLHSSSLPDPVYNAFAGLIDDGEEGALGELFDEENKFVGSDDDVECIASRIKSMGEDLGDVGASEMSLTRKTIHVHEVFRDGTQSAIVTISAKSVTEARRMLAELNRKACLKLSGGKDFGGGGGGGGSDDDEWPSDDSRGKTKKGKKGKSRK